MTHFQIERLDNQDGTHTIIVDHVQLGPPISWDDMKIEHYVRLMAERAEKHIPASHRRLLMPVSMADIVKAGNCRIEVVPLSPEEVSATMSEAHEAWESEQAVSS